MGSIGSGLVEGLLSGGAKVITTTSNSSLESIRFFEEMYRKFGSRGSQLVLVPFNQASSCDVEALIQYIYDSDGLGWDLDYIAPFAMFPECGKDAENTDSYSELTIRILLTNLLQMVGQIKAAKHRIDSPSIKSYEQLDHLRYLEGMVDLDKIVVVTGFGEVGAFGNAALRWEQEAHGVFSMEGCIELAWMMGLIKRFSGDHPGTRGHYIGWVDAKTQEPVHDRDVKAKYEPYILEHTGIRVVEPEAWGEDAVDMKSFMRELQIDQDMPPFETSAEEAAHFRRANGEKVDTWENPDGT
ncbi:fatty acid synthase alpha subunit Lsd1, partial [Linderina pennispora]